MRVSRSFINFAKLLGIGFSVFLLTSCKGRTVDNMEPSGNTIEVQIMPERQLSPDNPEN